MVKELDSKSKSCDKYTNRLLAMHIIHSYPPLTYLGSNIANYSVCFLGIIRAYNSYKREHLCVMGEDVKGFVAGWFGGTATYVIS